jgi:hypothetical protein
MDTFQKEVITTTIRHMFESANFSICTIDSCLKITGAIPNKNDYNALSALHCIKWNEMSEKLRQEVYEKTIAMLSGNGFDLSTIELSFNQQEGVFETSKRKRFRLLG